MLQLRPIVLSLVAVSVLNAGVLDGIFSGGTKPAINTNAGLEGIAKGGIPNINTKSILGSVSNAAVNNVLQGAASYMPEEVMGLCYDYKPKVSSAKTNICGFLKGGVNPCSMTPDLSQFGYSKKKSDAYLTKEIEVLRNYCDKVAGTAVKKASIPEAIETYSASSNVRSADPTNAAAIYGQGGLLGWDNIKAYTSGGKNLTNNYYLYKAVSTNDYLSFQYYKDILENSVGTGSGVRNKVNVFSPKELKDVTVSYKNLKDYEDDVKKIAGTLKTSTGQSSSVRISSMSEAEMIKAELEAASSNGTNAEAKKEGIANAKIDEVSDAVDKDIEYKTKFYRDITVNPNNRIVYPAKGYVDSLPPEKKVVAVKKIELQAKKDAMLRASFEEVGEMRKELSRLVMENAKVSSRQFNASAAQAEINALIK